MNYMNGDSREVLKGKFIPKDKERYYYLSMDGCVGSSYNSGSKSDNWLLKRQPVFRTHEECEGYKKFLEIQEEYTFQPDWNDPKQKKWAPIFSHSAHKVFLLSTNTLQYSGTYFESKEKGEAFFSKVGEEAVERYMFDYWR